MLFSMGGFFAAPFSFGEGCLAPFFLITATSELVIPTSFRTRRGMFGAVFEGRDLCRSFRLCEQRENFSCSPFFPYQGGGQTYLYLPFRSMFILFLPLPRARGVFICPLSFVNCGEAFAISPLSPFRALRAASFGAKEEAFFGGREEVRSENRELPRSETNLKNQGDSFRRAPA